MALDQLSAKQPAVIIGAGPAGLTAAHELVRRRVPVVILEQDTRVGGLAQTVEHRGFRFDIGGHRFFSRVSLITDLWRSVLGPDFIRRARLSRIHYRKRFFDYPLKAGNVLRNLGLLTSLRVLVSYLHVRLVPIRPEASFADWVSNRFGRQLYRMFFKTYTEKVWGIPCETISAQWAAQRIKGLSLRTAVVNMLFPRLNRRAGRTVKTLIDEFEYPRLGPGMMWEAFRARVEAHGGETRLECRVRALRCEGTRIVAVEYEQAGERREQPAGHVVSTMPLRELVLGLSPPAPSHVLEAAQRLRYRDFLMVAVMIDEPALFADQWIYVHDDSVRVGRIQNFKNWSPEMVPDPSMTCLGMEYFCFEHDELWTTADDDLAALAAEELRRIGLTHGGRVVDHKVVRMPKAYPIYEEGFSEALKTVRTFLADFDNLQPVGRNGMHKYNNQDHSMLTAILAVRNLFGEQHDLWGINADDDYHEEIRDDGKPQPWEGFTDDLKALAEDQRQVPTSSTTR